MILADFSYLKDCIVTFRNNKVAVVKDIVDVRVQLLVLRLSLLGGGPSFDLKYNPNDGTSYTSCSDLDIIKVQTREEYYKEQELLEQAKHRKCCVLERLSGVFSVEPKVQFEVPLRRVCSPGASYDNTRKYKELLKEFFDIEIKKHHYDAYNNNANHRIRITSDPETFCRFLVKRHRLGLENMWAELNVEMVN